VLQNEEIRTLITAIGTGIGDGEGEGAFNSRRPATTRSSS
jgi:DNA gyrase subunit B